mmetsp:Transcript_18831/g.49950  ORF Transcript_18831/g.49950 Transcript_18831/m.49950 type:complete len:127 (+) Transcript_18831:13-393(+)
MPSINIANKFRNAKSPLTPRLAMTSPLRPGVRSAPPRLDVLLFQSSDSLDVPDCLEMPDAQRFTPRNNVELFKPQVSEAMAVGLQLSPRYNTPTPFDRKMIQDKKAKRYVREKREKGSMVELRDSQ